jgi:hypothetical protein
MLYKPTTTTNKQASWYKPLSRAQKQQSPYNLYTKPKQTNNSTEVPNRATQTQICKTYSTLTATTSIKLL